MLRVFILDPGFLSMVEESQLSKPKLLRPRSRQEWRQPPQGCKNCSLLENKLYIGSDICIDAEQWWSKDILSNGAECSCGYGCVHTIPGIQPLGAQRKKAFILRKQNTVQKCLLTLSGRGRNSPSSTLVPFSNQLAGQSCLQLW